MLSPCGDGKDVSPTISLRQRITLPACPRWWYRQARAAFLTRSCNVGRCQRVLRPSCCDSMRYGSRHEIVAYFAGLTYNQGALRSTGSFFRWSTAMNRICIALVAFALMATLAPPSEAQISRNNPYRSFNLTGVNYASMQWERSHRRSAGKSWSTTRSSARFFRGR